MNQITQDPKYLAIKKYLQKETRKVRNLTQKMEQTPLDARDPIITEMAEIGLNIADFANQIKPEYYQTYLAETSKEIRGFDLVSGNYC